MQHFESAPRQEMHISQMTTTRLVESDIFTMGYTDTLKGPIFAAKFSPSGQWVATASLDSTSCVWDIKNKRLQRQYRNHEGNVLSGSPGGAYLTRRVRSLLSGC